MAKFYYIREEDSKRIYIKDIDYAEEKLEFTENVNEAYKDRDGWYAEPTRDYIKFHFTKAYPQVANLRVTETW